MKMISNMFALSTVLLALCLAGCAAPRVAERYVWPPPPDEPKIEFLGVYKTQSDLAEEGLAKLILGSDVSASLRNPLAITADGHGKVYVSDLKLNGVLVFDFTTRKVDMLAVESGQIFNKVSGIAIDNDGNIYVGDTDLKRIVVFDKNEKFVSNIDLSAQAKSVGLFAIDKARKRIVVPDPAAHKVHIVDFSGKFIKTIAKHGGTEEGFNYPTAAAFDPQGNIIVADTMNSHIERFAPDGTFLSLFGKRGDSPGEFAVIKGIAVDSEGHIYVTDSKANRFSVFTEKGELLLVIGTLDDADKVIGGMVTPLGIYIDQNDTIYMVEKNYARFQKYQYLNSAYLASHPITKDTVLAKPVVEEKPSLNKDTPPAKTFLQQKQTP